MKILLTTIIIYFSTAIFGQKIYNVKDIENYVKRKVNSSAKAKSGHYVIIDESAKTIIVKIRDSDGLNFKIGSIEKDKNPFTYYCTVTFKNGSGPAFIQQDTTQRWFKIFSPEDLEDMSGNYTKYLY